MVQIIKKLIVALLVICIAMSCFVISASAEITDKNLQGSLAVKGVHAGATIKFRHVIRHNPNNETGWEFYPDFSNANWKYETSTLQAFAEAYGVEETLLAKYGLTKNSSYIGNETKFIAYEQEVLKEVISDYSGRLSDNEGNKGNFSDTSSDTASVAMNGSTRFVQALENTIRNGVVTNTAIETDSDGYVKIANLFRANEHIGVYIIHPQDETGKYIYNPTAAFVMFDYNDGEIYSIPHVVAKAKGILNIVNKTSNDKSLAIGDKASYTIISTYPTFAEQYENTAIYTIKDYSNQLQYYTNVVVKVEGESKALTAGTDYIIAFNNSTAPYGFEIQMIDGNGTNGKADYKPSYVGKEITVTYDATVIGLTADGKVENTARVTTQPDSTQDAWVTESKYVTDTYEVHITKKNANGHTLSGAEFYAKTEDGKYVTFSYEKDPENYVYKYTVIGSSDTLTNNCVISFESRVGVTLSGLDADRTYTLSESKAPNGYVISESTIVLGTSNTSLGLTVSDPNKTQSVEADIDTSKTEYTVSTAGTDVFNIDYVNTKVFQLPETGWWGTYIFTFVGVAIIVTAVIINRNRKRNKAEA